MVQFNDWCLSVDEPVGNHFRRVMTGQAASLATGIQATAAIVPGHYASEEQVVRAVPQPSASSRKPFLGTGSVSKLRPLV
jgi:hypothetical protein